MSKGGGKQQTGRAKIGYSVSRSPQKLVKLGEGRGVKITDISEIKIFYFFKSSV